MQQFIMHNAATSPHITTEGLFWSWFFVLSKAKVRSQIGTLMDLKEKKNLIPDIRLASDWITTIVFKNLRLYQLVYRRGGHLF